jgi:hypothetical protein
VALRPKSWQSSRIDGDKAHEFCTNGAARWHSHKSTERYQQNMSFSRTDLRKSRPKALGAVTIAAVLSVGLDVALTAHDGSRSEHL